MQAECKQKQIRQHPHNRADPEYPHATFLSSSSYECCLRRFCGRAVQRKTESRGSFSKAQEALCTIAAHIKSRSKQCVLGPRQAGRRRALMTRNFGVPRVENGQSPNPSKLEMHSRSNPKQTGRTLRSYPTDGPIRSLESNSCTAGCSRNSARVPIDLL